MRFWRILLLGALIISIVSSLSAVDTVEFAIVARVRFSVPGDWTVIASKSDKNRTIFTFQVPNPADKGTPDSTNLTVQSFYLKDPDSEKEYQKKSSRQDSEAQDRPLLKSWECASFQAKQGSTSYEVWDCHRIFGEAGVYVRAAWPHLPKNATDYDHHMQMTLTDVLRSVSPSEAPSH